MAPVNKYLKYTQPEPPQDEPATDNKYLRFVPANDAAPQIGAPIDTNRPILENDDGSFSTERTITVQRGNRWYNVPTIINGQAHDPAEVTRRWEAGEQLPTVGDFASLPEAETAARARSDQIGQVRSGDRQRPATFAPTLDLQSQTAWKPDQVVADVTARMRPNYFKLPTPEQVGEDIGKGTSNIIPHIERGGVGAAESILNTPVDLAQGYGVPYAMSTNPSISALISEGGPSAAQAEALPEKFAKVYNEGGYAEKQAKLNAGPRFDFSGAKMPIADDQQSVTGGLIEGLAQFLVTRKLVGTASPGGRIAAQLGKDVGSTFVGFEGNSGRLSDVIDSNAVPAGPLRDYLNFLKTQPSDSPIVGRFKNMLEDLTVSGPMVAPQAAVRGAEAGVKGLANIIDPNRAQPTPPAAAAPPPAPTPSVPVQLPATQQQQPPTTLPNLTPRAPTAAPTAGPVGPAEQAFAALHPKVQDSIKRIMARAGMGEPDIAQTIATLNQLPPDRLSQYATQMIYNAGQQFPDLEGTLMAVERKLGMDAPKGKGDIARNIVNDSAREVVGSERNYLAKVAEENFGPGAVHTQADIDAKLEELGARYNKFLDPESPYGAERKTKAGSLTPAAQANRTRIDAARTALAKYLKAADANGEIPDWLRRDAVNRLNKQLRQMGFEPIERGPTGGFMDATMIDEYPTLFAHALQSSYATAAREAKDAIRGDIKAGALIRDLSEKRGRSRVRANAANPDDRGFGLLHLLEEATPKVGGKTYRETRIEFGTEKGTETALRLPERILSVGTDEVKAKELLDDLEDLSPSQFEAAKNQVTTAVRNQLSKKPENLTLTQAGAGEAGSVAPNTTALANTGFLKVLEDGFGDEGKALAQAIRHSRANTGFHYEALPRVGSKSGLNLEDAANAGNIYEHPLAKDQNIIDTGVSTLAGAGVLASAVNPVVGMTGIAMAAGKALYNAWKNGLKLSPKQTSQLADFLFAVRRASEEAPPPEFPNAPRLPEPPAGGGGPAKAGVGGEGLTGQVVAGGIGASAGANFDYDGDGTISAEERVLGALGGFASGFGGVKTLKRTRGPQTGASQMTFGGVNAKTADKKLLRIAEDMERAGAGRDQIWKETGWFKGKDGKWRFEIDDSGLAVGEGYGAGKKSPIRHSELERAYPKMKGDTYSSVYAADADFGNYNHNYKSLNVYGSSYDSRRSIAAHELQHAVQGDESFARGGSRDAANAGLPLAPDMKVLEQAHMIQYLAKNMGGIDEYFRKFPDALPDGTPYETAATALARDPSRLEYFDELLRLHQNPQETYNRLAGEVEARNVQTRRDFTPEERRAKPPWTTQDVPDDQQIVRYGSGKAESRGGKGGSNSGEPPKPPGAKGFTPRVVEGDDLIRRLEMAIEQADAEAFKATDLNRFDHATLERVAEKLKVSLADSPDKKELITRIEDDVWANIIAKSRFKIIDERTEPRILSREETIKRGEAAETIRGLFGLPTNRNVTPLKPPKAEGPPPTNALSEPAPKTGGAGRGFLDDESGNSGKIPDFTAPIANIYGMAKQALMPNDARQLKTLAGVLRSLPEETQDAIRANATSPAPRSAMEAAGTPVKLSELLGAATARSSDDVASQTAEDAVKRYQTGLADAVMGDQRGELVDRRGRLVDPMNADRKAGPIGPMEKRAAKFDRWNDWSPAKEEEANRALAALVREGGKPGGGIPAAEGELDNLREGLIRGSGDRAAFMTQNQLERADPKGNAFPKPGSDMPPIRLSEILLDPLRAKEAAALLDGPVKPWVSEGERDAIRVGVPAAGVGLGGLAAAVMGGGLGSKQSGANDQPPAPPPSEPQYTVSDRMVGTTSPFELEPQLNRFIPDTVRTAQQRLMSTGYAPHDLKPGQRFDDGKEGAATRSVVLDFQRDKGLPLTGILDPQTLRAIWGGKNYGALPTMREYGEQAAAPPQ